MSTYLPLVESWEILVRNGYPPNLASRRLELDMPDIEGGDEPYGLDPDNRGRLRDDAPRNNDNTNEPADRNDRQPEPG